MQVLDYFEFRYSNPSSDFERFFLDDLPSEMQTRMISQVHPMLTLFRTDAFGMPLERSSSCDSGTQFCH